MLISQQLKDAIKVAKAARASVERAEGMSPSELSMTIDALAQSSISLESVVEAAYCEGVFIDESVRDVVGAQLEAACKMADVVKQSNSRAINPGSALEAAVVLARKLEIDTVEAERKLADSFFHRLTPSYTESGNAKNVLTLDNDVLDLPELTQTTLLDSLNLRFQREVIYTHVGDVVVSVNPFKPTGSVGSSLLSRYRTGERRELPPHIYGLMARAYNTMLMQARQPVEFGIDHASNEGTSHAIAPPTLETPHQPSRLVAAANQSVIITGESGAGKTEAMKICLQFITWVSSGANSPNFSPVRSRRSSSKDTTWQSPPPPTMENTCVHKLLLTNPVMEALGNAATVRNHNSSRFGKHFDIQVHSHSGEIIGAHTSVYLLEKPRIASHALEERNFHIFYMLLHAPAEFRQSCSLSSKWEDYSILSYDVSSTTFSSVDFERFEEMNDSFLTLGFSEEEREQCFRMIALVLQLGNLQFVPLGSDDEEGCSVKDAAQLKICADLLRVDPETLQAALCWRKMGGGGAVEQYTLARSAAAARMVRGSMCMHIYSLVFGWVVQEINKLISAPGEGAVCMGLLDIFGFENFGQNSFPQLCINYTNEMLHNLFIEHVIKQEQEVYIREGVEWTLVDYADNTHIVNLIAARPICIFGVLDDGCRTGNNFSVLNALHEKFASEGREVRGYIKPKHNGNECFVVSHYAGEVTYYIRNFVELNRDELSLDIQELLETRSGFEHLRALAKQEASKRENRAGDHGRGAGRRSTVSREFGRSVEALVSRLRANQPHYIRCLKPNQQLEPSVWDQVYMSKQLAYSGLLEVALVRQAGFAHRREFDAFYGYYKVCLATIKHKELVTKTGRERVAGLLEELHVDSSHYLIGHRLVFLRKQALEVLDVERGKHHSRVFFAMMLVSTCIARFARRVRKRLALALQEEAERLALDSDGEDADEAKRLRKFELRGALLRSLKAAKLKAKEKTELQDAAAPSVHEATRLFESKFQSSGPAAAARARELATEAPRRAGMGTLIGMFDAKVAKEGVSRRFDARSMPPHVDRGQESVAWNHKHQVQQDKEYEQQLEALRREFAEQFQTLREELVHVHKQARLVLL
ncbi:hypothetical protein AB1Y20_020770 [Prymnesium parvum]|uniref:Myosin motor domain-containing protein n=1 Tax=Prymnesium parvum TaxID=97485 RepID=A0AB34JUJ9_PRYPA